MCPTSDSIILLYLALCLTSDIAEYLPCPTSDPIILLYLPLCQTSDIAESVQGLLGLVSECSEWERDQISSTKSISVCQYSKCLSGPVLQIHFVWCWNMKRPRNRDKHFVSAYSFHHSVSRDPPPGFTFCIRCLKTVL